jgi:membrane protease YdiL (CAAX protease family)
MPTLNENFPIVPTGFRIALVLIAFFILNVIFQVIGAFVANVDISALGKPETISIKGHAIIGIFGLIATLIIIFLFRKYSDLKSISSMGFPIKGKSKDLIWGLLVATIIMSIGTIILLVNKDVSITGFNFDTSNFSYGFLLFITVALSEEILCRGYILNNLMGTMNKYYALAISSVIFALMHSFNSNLSWFGMLNLFIAGILLGSTYIYTKNLWFPISFHLFWNFIQGCVFDYNVSGLDINSIFKFDMPVKNSFNGGDFGFEGSWLCTLLCSCVILIIRYYYNRQNKTAHIQRDTNI